MPHTTEESRVKDAAGFFGAVYIDLKKEKKFQRVFKRQLAAFKKKSHRKNINGSIARQLIDFRYHTSATSSKAVQERYDIEYSSFASITPILKQKYADDGKCGRTNIFFFLNRQFNSVRVSVLAALFSKRSSESTYMFLNALLSGEGFEIVIGLSLKELGAKRIFDVGAGSNELLRFLKSNGVPAMQLFGSDISSASVAIIERDGCTGYEGRIEDLSGETQKNDLVFLSYFIDYDTNQKATFEAALAMTAPGGKIIFEGKLPCNPVGLFKEDQKKNFITKGESVSSDIRLICGAFTDIAQKHNRSLSVERVVSGRRYVYSSVGFCDLPSYFIVFGVV